MKYILLAVFTVLCILSFAQISEISIGEKWKEEGGAGIPITHELIAKGTVIKGNWGIVRLTTPHNYSWIKFKLVWDEQNSIEAEDTLVLEDIASQLEYLARVKKINTGASKYINDINYQLFEGEIYVGFKYRSGKAEGKKISKSDALKLAKFLRSTYHFYIGYDQPVLNCINLLVDAADSCEAGNFEYATKLYKKLIIADCGQNANNIASDYAECMIAAKNYEKAIDVYDWIINFWGTCYKCHKGVFFKDRAKVKLIYTEDYEGALADLNKALEVKETNTRYNLRSQVYEKLNMPIEAKQDLDRIFKLDSLKYTDIIFKANKELSSLKDERYDLKKKAEKYQSIVNAKKQLGDKYPYVEDSIKVHYYDSLYTVFMIDFYTNKIEKEKQKTYIMYRLRAGFYTEAGQFDNAEKDYNKSLKLKDDDVYTYINRSKHYIVKGDAERAMVDANQAIELAEPGYNRSIAKETKAKVFLLSGDKQSACGIYKEIMAEEGSSNYLESICE